MRSGILAGEFMMDTLLAGGSTFITLAATNKISTEKFKLVKTSTEDSTKNKSRDFYCGQPKIGDIDQLDHVSSHWSSDENFVKEICRPSENGVSYLPLLFP
jgi:hypothetical protein